MVTPSADHLDGGSITGTAGPAAAAIAGSALPEIELRLSVTPVPPATIPLPRLSDTTLSITRDPAPLTVIASPELFEKVLPMISRLGPDARRPAPWFAMNRLSRMV